MAPKSFALFLCVLVFSPIAHAWISGQESLAINAKRLDSPIFKLLNGVKGHFGDLDKLGDISSNAEGQEQIGLLTTNPVQYYCSANNPNLIAILDSIGGICLLIDLNLQICLLLRGDGTGLIIKCSINVVLYVPVGVYNSTINDLKTYIDNCDVNTISNLPTNTVVNLNSPGNTILNSCLTIMGGISADAKIRISADLSNGLNVTISICCQIVTLLSTNLLGLLDLRCDNFITLNGDLSCLISILEAIVDLILSAGITLATLVTGGVIIVLRLILTAADGCRGLIVVLTAIGLVFDLTLLLGSVITNIAIFLRLCFKCGGSVYTGVNGIIGILYFVIAFLYGLISIAVCLEGIITACCQISGVLSIIATVNAVIGFINDQIGQWSNAGGWNDLQNFFQSILAGTCIIFGVNVTAILNLCLAGIITTVLALVVNIVKLLTVFLVGITVNVYWATLIRVIFFLLKTIVGRIICNILIPTLNIVINLLSPCLNLLSGTGLTLAFVLAILAGVAGLLGAILVVPVLTTIWNLVAAECNNQAGINLYNALNAVPTEKALITNYMSTITNLGCV